MKGFALKIGVPYLVGILYKYNGVFVRNANFFWEKYTF